MINTTSLYKVNCISNSLHIALSPISDAAVIQIWDDRISLQVKLIAFINVKYVSVYVTIWPFKGLMAYSCLMQIELILMDLTLTVSQPHFITPRQLLQPHSTGIL